MPKLFDLVKVNIATTGTGTVTFGSVFSPEFFTPSEVGAVDGDTVRYVLIDGTDIELGTGTIGGSVTTMTRTVTRSRVGGIAGTSLLNLSGTAYLALTAAAADILNPAVSGGQLPATATNDSAAAGKVGEFASSTRASGSALALTTSTQTNVTSVSLTAGDWDVFGTVAFNTGASTVVSATIGGVNTTSATLGAPTDGGYFNVPGDAHNTVFPTGVKRVSLAATTTVYLVAYSTFSTSTQSVYGSIFARRVR